MLCALQVEVRAAGGSRSQTRATEALAALRCMEPEPSVRRLVDHVALIEDLTGVRFEGRIGTRAHPSFADLEEEG